jgi:hypothetical protein
VSLSGNLGFVSLDEVLRLLTRSKQSGAVDVKGDAVEGRIYMDRRGVGLATTFSDETLRRHLTQSGLLDPSQVSSIASGSAELSSLQEPGPVTALLREMSVESLYQLSLHGVTFEVNEGETSRFAAPDSFDLEELLADARQRLTDWEEVRTIVSDMDRDLHLKKSLGERDKVTLDRDSWRVVAEMGRSASIRGLAEQLGTTEFWTARVAAGLLEDELMTMNTVARVEESTVDATPEPVPADRFPFTEPEEPTNEYESPATSELLAEAFAEADAAPAELEPAQASDVEPVAFEPEAVETSDPDPGHEAEPLVAAAATEPIEEPEIDPNQSWWKEPVRDSESAEDSETGEDADFEPARVAAATAEVEEDTESFLEKVFSELEPEPEAEEGYGLLRRRRMGTLRDMGNS